MPSTPQPVEIDYFVERCFDCHVVYEDIDPHVLGFTAFNSQGRVELIGVSRRLFAAGSVDRQRAWATIAHEAGHGLLHRELFAGPIGQHTLFDGHVDLERRRILCRQADFGNRSGTYDGRWWEWQANQAIGGLLLPSKLVIECVQPLLEPSGALGIMTLPDPIPDVAIRRVATTFLVNPIVARIRLSELFPRADQPSL